MMLEGLMFKKIGSPTWGSENDVIDIISRVSCQRGINS